MPPVAIPEMQQALSAPESIASVLEVREFLCLRKAPQSLGPQHSYLSPVSSCMDYTNGPTFQSGCVSLGLLRQGRGRQRISFGIGTSLRFRRRGRGREEDEDD